MSDEARRPRRLTHCNSLDEHHAHTWWYHERYTWWQYGPDKPAEPLNCPGMPARSVDYRCGFRAGIEGRRSWITYSDPAWARRESPETREWWERQTADYQAGYIDAATLPT